MAEGYSLTIICKTLGYSQSIYYRRKRVSDSKTKPKSRIFAEDDLILTSIKEIKLRHHFFGYRRV